MEVSDPKVGASVDGRYRLDQPLGAGGMGAVYKGHHLKTGTLVAVKFLHDSFVGVPDLVKRFEREVSALSRIAHPNVVAIIDSGVSGGVPYLVMDFLSGTSLDRLLTHGALPPERAMEITLQVLAGVGEAHAHGVVHRDLKPDNIICLDGMEGDCIKILDFGLAKLVDGTTRLTSTGLTLGTPAYMAPEQAHGTSSDERTDLYAIGVMLYQMVTGRRPFIAESPMAVLRMHMEETPVPPRKASQTCRISAALEAVILRALEKDPTRRWSTAAAFAAGLAATPEGGSSVIAPVEPALQETACASTMLAPAQASGAKYHSDRRNWGRPTLVVLLMLFVAGAALGWRRLSRRQQQRVQQRVTATVEDVREKVVSLIPKDLPPPSTGTATGRSSRETARPDAISPAVAAPPTARTESRPVPTDNDDDEPDAPPPPSDTPGGRLEAEARDPGRAPAQATRKPPRLADAKRLLATRKVDDAISTLYQLRRTSPRSAQVALLLGHAYFRKQWRTDGLREYESALTWRPSLRGNRLLVRNTVVSLDDPTYRPARALLRNRLGTTALRELRRGADDARNSKVQKRAARLASQIARKGRR